MKKIGFIGSGNMGGALICGVCNAIDPSEVMIFDTDTAKSKTLADKTGCIVAESGIEIAENCQYIVLAVKPQVLRDVLAGLTESIKTNVQNGKSQALVSIAAGISIADLSLSFENAEVKLPVIRVMPNTPSEIGEGMNLYAVNVPAENYCEEFEKIFSKCGLMEKVSENMIDVATAVTGCSPAFVYMFIEALADGAVRCGVPRDMAIRYAAQAVKGSAAMVLETGRHPDRLKDAVCSPGGSTIVGVATLENSAFRAAAANRVFYANEKNKELGK